MKPGRELLVLVEDIYKAADGECQWAPILRSLQGRLKSPACAIAVHDFTTGRGAIECAVGIKAAYVASYRERYAPLNPWLRWEECYRSAGSIWTGQQLARNRDLLMSEFYWGWLKPQNLFHQSSAILHSPDSETAFLWALRPPASGPFHQGELEQYGVLVRHLCQAYELSRRLASLSVRRPYEPREVRARRSGAVLVVDGDRNEGAAGDNVERPRATGIRLQVHENGAGPGREQGVVAGGETALSRPCEGKHEFPAKAAPVPKSPAAAVVVEDPVTAEDRWRELYHLTRAEARLAILLARGLSVRDAGERLDIRITTARTHLQRIFDKTDTRRQSELVALLLGAVRRAPAAEQDGVARWRGRARGELTRERPPSRGRARFGGTIPSDPG